MAMAAFPINLLSPASTERLLEMMEPSYAKSSTTASVKSPIAMEMLGTLLVSWHMKFKLLFFTLIVKPLHA